MKIRFFCFWKVIAAVALLGFLGLSSETRSTADAPAAAPDPVKDALPFLQSGYVGFNKLGAPTTDRMDDLVRRAQGGILWMANVTPARSVSTTPVVLPDGTIYGRAANFVAAADWPAFAAQWKTSANQPAGGFILDLRNTATPDDFEGAARLAGLFVPTGTALFTVRKAGGDERTFASSEPVTEAMTSPVAGPLAVLINGETAGAAEALAAALRANGAVLLGSSTAGTGAEFTEQALTSGGVLRYVSGEVTMADGTTLWRHPVEPDIGLPVDPKKEAVALGLIEENRILEVIREAAGSHRLSEAALVRGEDPAVEAYLVPTVKPAGSTAPQDATLVAALDSLKAIRTSREAPAVAGAEQPGKSGSLQ